MKMNFVNESISFKEKIMFTILYFKMKFDFDKSKSNFDSNNEDIII